MSKAREMIELVNEGNLVQKMKKDGIKLMKETAKKAATARLGGDMKTAKKLDAEIEAIYKAAKDAGVDEDDMVQAEEDGRESAK